MARALAGFLPRAKRGGGAPKGRRGPSGGGALCPPLPHARSARGGGKMKRRSSPLFHRGMNVRNYIIRKSFTDQRNATSFLPRAKRGGGAPKGWRGPSAAERSPAVASRHLPHARSARGGGNKERFLNRSASHPKTVMARRERATQGEATGARRRTRSIPGSEWRSFRFQLVGPLSAGHDRERGGKGSGESG